MSARRGLALLLLAAACRGTNPAAREAAASRDAFWTSLRTLCGQAFAGRMIEGNASDSAFRTAELRMHVRECSRREIRIPFHRNDDRSRTWVLKRSGDELRLEHDHRHEDGSADRITRYGGASRGGGTATRQEFPADLYTAALVPAARTNVWTIEIVPGSRFVYALRREGTDRRFRVEFDLTKPIAPPPAPWGARR